jgi:phosphate transport system substrate-binding protein
LKPVCNPVSFAFVFALASAGFALASAGCKSSTSSGGPTPEADEETATPDIIAIDGSSTVYPITEAVAEEFRSTNRARVTIGVSGTGGGFKKFCGGETAITGASRPIKPSEVQQCEASKISYVELPIAYDGLSVVVSPTNDWVDHVTVEELKRLWQPEAQGEIMRWNQLRAGWPDEEIHLFGAGVDSGTYDYFTAAIVGKEHSSRGDFTSSEDDNVLVQGIATDRLALGFFGYAYYAENRERLRLLAVDDGKADNGAGPIAPSPTSVADGSYQPLSRPIFIYASRAALERPEVAAFLDFYVNHAPKLAAEVGYIALPPKAYGLVGKRLTSRTEGSLFAGKGSTVGATVEDLLGAK